MLRTVDPFRPTRSLARNRVGAFIGTTLVLLLVTAVLLASRDLWTLQARAVGRLLDAAGVRSSVVTSPQRLAKTTVGELSREGRVRKAHAPAVEVDPPTSTRRPSDAQTAAAIAFAAAAVGALVTARRLPAPLKGFLLLAGLVTLGSMAYAAWWSDLAPLDVSRLLVDWRTSALAPMVGVALLFAYDIYPLPGGLVVKTVWMATGLAATAVFSTFRLAAVAAGYAAFGPPAFLPLHVTAGVFWDVAPGIAVLALANAGLSFAAHRRPLLARLRIVPRLRIVR